MQLLGKQILLTFSIRSNCVVWYQIIILISSSLLIFNFFSGFSYFFPVFLLPRFIFHASFGLYACYNQLSCLFSWCISLVICVFLISSFLVSVPLFVCILFSLIFTKSQLEIHIRGTKSIWPSFITPA